MSVNDYAAHQERKQRGAKTAEPQPKPAPVHEPLIEADPIEVEESALTDTFVGKLRKFWGG